MQKKNKWSSLLFSYADWLFKYLSFPSLLSSLMDVFFPFLLPKEQIINVFIQKGIQVKFKALFHSTGSSFFLLRLSACVRHSPRICVFRKAHPLLQGVSGLVEPVASANGHVMGQMHLQRNRQFCVCNSFLPGIRAFNFLLCLQK